MLSTEREVKELIVNDPERCKACSCAPEMCAYCDSSMKSAANATENALKQLVFTVIDNSAKAERK